MKNAVVWVDIPTTDIDRAVAFYAAVMGVEMGVVEIPGFRFGLLPHTESAVGGCLYEPEDGNLPATQGPLIYLNVEGRMAEALAAVERHGGTVVQAVRQIGEHGWRALVVDSEGNRIALHAPEA